MERRKSSEATTRLSAGHETPSLSRTESSANENKNNIPM
jgi:hypothetical protein